MKKLLVIDWILIIAYVLSACSGIELHIAGHGNSHETWYNRAMFHAIMSFLFFVYYNIPFGDTLGLVQRNHQKRNGQKK